MTFRAVLIGIVLSAALASFGYVNDTWFFFSYIGGDLLPTHAFGVLLIGLLLINPLFRRIRAFRFKAGEWVVILSLMFMGSVLAGSGMFWQMPHPLITPIQDHLQQAGWKEKDLLQYVPKEMMVKQVYREYAHAHGIQRNREETWSKAIERAYRQKRVPEEDYQRLQAQHAEILTNYMQGTGRPGRRISFFEDVPWYGWYRTLSFWFLVLALATTAGISAVVIVHRQWSQREHLSYPIVTFTNELVTHDGKGLFNPIFRNRTFWLGFGVSFIILFINGYQKSWNNAFIKIPTGINFNSLRQLHFMDELLKKVTVGRNILNVRFYFAAVGLAYFLTSEASFSLGISGWLYILAAAPFAAAGVNMSRTHLGGGLPSNMYFGAYLGMGLMVLYLGRRFYGAVLKRALFLPDAGGEVLNREAWACRVLLITSAALVGVLWRIGLHPVLGIGFVALAGLLFLMLGRINAATGLFVIQPLWHPVNILLAMFGAYALGPHALAILAMLCVVITVDTRIAMVPLVCNALKLGDLQKVKPGSLAGWMSVAMIISMLVALPFTIWLVYDKGVAAMKSGGTDWALTVARMPFELIDRYVDKLDATGQLAEAATGNHLLSASPQNHFFTAAGIGLVLVLVCSYLRLRFPRWPLHPLMFLVWGTPWMVEYAPSFLLAWLLKSVIMKYGGQKAYHKAKPFFIGLVAGEFAAAMLWATVSVVYYLRSGTTPPDTFRTRE